LEGRSGVAFEAELGGQLGPVELEGGAALLGGSVSILVLRLGCHWGRSSLASAAIAIYWASKRSGEGEERTPTAIVIDWDGVVEGGCGEVREKLQH
jgi:hypothetical protein